MQIWNLTFEKYHFGPLKKWIFGFWRKPPPKKLSSCFGFDSALKKIDAQMFLWAVFLKTHTKKVIDRQKSHFDCFWRLITVFFRAGNLLIRSSLIHSFAHFAQIKWATVSDSLRSLKTNEPNYSLKLNQSQNTKNKTFRGVFFKNQKHTFSGFQNGTF